MTFLVLLYLTHTVSNLAQECRGTVLVAAWNVRNCGGSQLVEPSEPRQVFKKSLASQTSSPGPPLQHPLITQHPPLRFSATTTTTQRPNFCFFIDFLISLAKIWISHDSELGGKLATSWTMCGLCLKVGGFVWDLFAQVTKK